MMIYLRNIVDLPCQPGFNNSLDCLHGGHYADDLCGQLDAAKQTKVSNTAHSLVTLLLSCTSKTYVKNVQTCPGWILRTFTTRDSITMITLFKSIVLPRIDYGSKLWSPHLVKHIDKLENSQRSFTKHITGMPSLEYSKRLVSLKLYSLQRRRECYCIIYVWKIIEGLVPNFSKPIVCSYSREQRKLIHYFHM